MLLIGYFYDIKSERKLKKEIQVNLAYRWFIGYDIDEKIPDHSVISQTRRRKFSNSGIFQEIFDEIVRKLIDKGLVEGDTILTDSTHIKANASKRSFVPTKEYLENLCRLHNFLLFKEACLSFQPSYMFLATKDKLTYRLNLTIP